MNSELRKRLSTISTDSLDREEESRKNQLSRDGTKRTTPLPSSPTRRDQKDSIIEVFVTILS